MNTSLLIVAAWCTALLLLPVLLELAHDRDRSLRDRLAALLPDAHDHPTDRKADQ